MAEGYGRGICPHILQKELHPVRKRTVAHILKRLFHRRRVHIDTPHLGMGGTLGGHQRNESAATPHIQYAVAAGEAGPGTQQDTVRADFHRTTVVLDFKLAKGKRIIHTLFSIVFIRFLRT